MILPRRALRYPAPQQILLFGGQALVRRRRRHDGGRARGSHPADQEAFIRPARSDYGAVLSRGICAFTNVQPEVGHPGSLIRPVALKTVIGKDRPNLPLEIDGWIGRRCQYIRQAANAESQQHATEGALHNQSNSLTDYRSSRSLKRLCEGSGAER